MVDSFDIGGVQYSWDSEARVLRNTFVEGTIANRSKGILVVRALKRWLAGSQEPYALLCNGGGVKEIDSGYREEFAKLFQLYPNVYLAVYNFGVDVAMIPRLFQMATKIDLKAFRTPSEAHSWMRSEGFNV